jgi:hypothetical protein
LNHLHNRKGLAALCNRLFRAPTLKSVVQVRTESKERSILGETKTRGVQVSLRTLELKGIENINERLTKFAQDGIFARVLFLIQGATWVKYGCWDLADDSIGIREWVIFGVWPASIIRVNCHISY